MTVREELVGQDSDVGSCSCNKRGRTGMELTRTAADRLQNGILEVVHIFQDESIVRERNEMGIEPRVLQINEAILFTRLGPSSRPSLGE